MPPKGHLAKSGDIFCLLQPVGQRGATDIEVVEANDAAKNPTMYRNVPPAPQQELSVPEMSVVPINTVGKLCHIVSKNYAEEKYIIMIQQSVQIFC